MCSIAKSSAAHAVGFCAAMLKWNSSCSDVKCPSCDPLSREMWHGVCSERLLYIEGNSLRGECTCSHCGLGH